jgi:uncharacterized protein (TIGR00725 family)
LKLKIGVIGSGSSSDPTIGELAYETGREIARNDCILLTGAGPGLPYEAARGAREEGGQIIGFSPALNLQEHVERYGYPTDLFDVIIYTGFGLKGRNLLLVRSCDGVVAISGRIGTLNEFTISYDEGKTIGVLKGTGGISDYIEDIVRKSGKEGGKVISEPDHEKLIKELIENLR